MPKYTTIAGTEPSEDTKHEPRTLTRTDTDGAVYMMTEIEDGIFVQWSQCAKCSEHISSCSCKGGPQEAKYMTEWREKRFANSIKGRKSPKPMADDEAPEGGDADLGSMGALRGLRDQGGSGARRKFPTLVRRWMMVSTRPSSGPAPRPTQTTCPRRTRTMSDSENAEPDALERAVTELVDEGADPGNVIAGPCTVQLNINVADATTPEQAVNVVIDTLARQGLGNFFFLVTETRSGREWMLMDGRVYDDDDLAALQGADDGPGDGS